MPGLRVARTYQPSWLAKDLLAGIVLSALLVPQGMAYAEMAGLPTITGLYATVVCLLAYAAFGPSPYLLLGPDSSLGPMIAAAILPLAAGDENYAIALAGMLALMVGMLCVGAGAARLGFVADLISKAVLLSIIQFFYRAWQPHYAIMGKTPQVVGYHDVSRYPDAEQISGLLMLRWDAPIFFANANIFRKVVREQVAMAKPTPNWVLIAAEPITDVDSTAADMLVDLDLELNAAGISLIIAELKDHVREKIERYGLLDTIDHRHFYPTIEAAVEEFHHEVGKGG